MTGIVAAIAAAGGLNFASGLYGPAGPQAFTITSSAGGQSQISTITINYTWLGYLRPSVSGTNTLTINSVYSQFTDSFSGPRVATSQFGSPSSVSRIWLGSLAISGFTTGNANATSSNSTATYSPTLVANTNYPVRYNWQATLPYSATAYFDGFSFYPGWTNGSCSFGVTNGAGYYNSVTNGF